MHDGVRFIVWEAVRRIFSQVKIGELEAFVHLVMVVRDLEKRFLNAEELRYFGVSSLRCRIPRCTK